MNNFQRFSIGLLALGMTSLAGAAPPATHALQSQALTPAAPTTPGAAVTGVESNAASKVQPNYMTYTYYGDRYRDPFIPLNGDLRSADLLDRAPQIASLTLKGIVQDANGRMALLVSGVNSYILHGGRLYDGRNRPVKKISGVIKTDSVVLIGSDRTVRELKTRTEL
jgi:hypothetical protein